MDPSSLPNRTRRALPALAGAACLMAPGCASSDLARYHAMLDATIEPAGRGEGEHATVHAAPTDAVPLVTLTND